MDSGGAPREAPRQPRICEAGTPSHRQAVSALTRAWRWRGVFATQRPARPPDLPPDENDSAPYGVVTLRTVSVPLSVDVTASLVIDRVPPALGNVNDIGSGLPIETPGALVSGGGS